jgi:hypothetical protein
VCRFEDMALTALTDATLVLVYTCVLVIKTCDLSPVICSTYGFGKTPKGALAFVKRSNSSCLLICASVL